MEEATKEFFTSAHYAVAGASSDRSKFGHKCKLPKLEKHFI